MRTSHDAIPQLDGYTDSYNRARCGSGGVCLLVKIYIIELYNVSILDKESICTQIYSMSHQCLCLLSTARGFISSYRFEGIL